MTITKKEKLINAVLSRMSDYKLTSEIKITDLDELNNFINNKLGYGYSLTEIEQLYDLNEARAKEYFYENGLKFLICEINFKKDGISHTIIHQTLTPDYNSMPIVRITNLREKNIHSKYKIFPKSTKDIELEKTIIECGKHVDSFFETYKLNDGCLMLEKYGQGYSVLNEKNKYNILYEGSDKDLSRLCGRYKGYLEITYYKEEPIFSQLVDGKGGKKAVYDEIDTKTIAEKIDNEVDLIVTNIHLLIDEYEKKHSYVKKLKI